MDFNPTVTRCRQTRRDLDGDPRAQRTLTWAWPRRLQLYKAGQRAGLDDVLFSYLHFLLRAMDSCDDNLAKGVLLAENARNHFSTSQTLSAAFCNIQGRKNTAVRYTIPCTRFRSHSRDAAEARQAQDLQSHLMLTEDALKCSPTRENVPSSEPFTADDLVAAQDALEAEARDALPFSFSQCTYDLGYIRQPVYACLTCLNQKGVCGACSISCHG